MTAELPPGPYRIILADPPWAFRVRSAKGMGRSAEQHYRTLSPGEIRDIDVGAISAPDAVLFLWVTDPFLEDGMSLGRHWGFTYRTVAFTWVKTGRDGRGFPMGTGYWTRANPELCLLFTRGRIGRAPGATDVARLVVAPRREHSRKPDEVVDRIDRLMGPEGARIELFARTPRQGWDAWGDQVGRFGVPVPGLGEGEVAA
ncbi:MAG: hypothetical protein RLZZ127_2378 [Planctomycetota bacterium]